jgi:fused signal recognition particle receptor
MLGRSGTQSLDALERELRDKRTRLEEEERNVETEKRLAATAGDERLDQTAAELYGGRISPDEAAAADAEVEKTRAGHRANADRHRRVIRLLTDEITELERTIAEAPFDEALAKLPELEKQHQAAASAFAKSLRVAATAGARLTRTRAGLDELLDQAKASRPEWRQLEIELADEEGWPKEAKELIKLLQSGPRQPAKQQSAALAKEAADREQSDRQRLREIVAERGAQLGGSRENDALVLRQKYSPLLPRADEVLDLIEAERQRQRAAYAERQARAGHYPNLLEV